MFLVLCMNRQPIYSINISLFSTKDCKYFDKGNGACPFGKNCFYKHALPNGELVPKEKPRYQASSSGESRIMCAVSLREFLEERESRLDYLLEMDAEEFFIVAASLISLSDDEDDDDDYYDDITDDSASTFSV